MGWALPRLRSKRLALRLVWRLGDLLTDELSGVKGREFVIGAAEYKALYKKISPQGRARDLTSMALQAFTHPVVETPRWILEVLDNKKPVLRLRVKKP
ncbi:MAG: hypothetical protein RMJ28_06905 [Nitrososphaerota archaeon]|nr:hypothetical protein [Candidatus Calditenuaceae archaeon]MDW8073942.1 hypothetical protein [Nitrososphaerota archaeon]